MPRFDVFLSHNSVDKPWVTKLKDDLFRYGVSVWLDEDEIRPGDHFAKALEKGLADSRAMALIISPEAMASGWVEEEYYRALSLAKNKTTALQLIPVILREAELPGFLRDRSWVDFRDVLIYADNVWRLVWGITGKKPAQLLDLNTILPPINRAVPKPGFQIESPYGTMLPDSPFYIERPADRDGWHFLNKKLADTIYVQAPRQMGKSSLLRRLSHFAEKEKGWATAFIDFEKFTEQQLADEEELLIEFCHMISDALRIPENIGPYWTSRRRSNIIKCSNYVAQYVIPTVGQPFILVMDEVERVLGTTIRNNFFGMLRTWHNDRAWDKNYAQMTLFLSSSTEPHLFIDNTDQSPFNVARPLELRDFDQAEVAELNRRHGAPLTQTEVGEMMNLLNGHPFLTRVALYLLSAGSIDFRTLIGTATSDAGPFGDHLRRYWQMVSDKADLKRALDLVINNQTHPENKLFYRLKGAGLIKKDDSLRRVTMRNALYRHYFSERSYG